MENPDVSSSLESIQVYPNAVEESIQNLRIVYHVDIAGHRGVFSHTIISKPGPDGSGVRNLFSNPHPFAGIAVFCSLTNPGAPWRRNLICKSVKAGDAWLTFHSLAVYTIRRKQGRQRINN